MSSQSIGESDQQVLVREFHHRLANEFQVMISLVGRCQRASDAERAILLDDLSERIHVFAALNRLLAVPPYDGNFRDHCRELGELVLRAFGRSDVVLDFEFEDVVLTKLHRFYLALIIVELIMNALKHGSLIEHDALRVTLNSFESHAELTVSSRAREATSFIPPTPRMAEALARLLAASIVVKHKSDHRVQLCFPTKVPDRFSARSLILASGRSA